MTIPENEEGLWDSPRKKASKVVPGTSAPSSAPKIRAVRQTWLDRIANPSYTRWRSLIRWQRIFLQDPSQYDPEALSARLAELGPLIVAQEHLLTATLDREKTAGRPLGPEWEKADEKRLRLLGQWDAIREALTWWEKRPSLLRSRDDSHGFVPLQVVLESMADPFAEE